MSVGRNVRILASASLMAMAMALPAAAQQKTLNVYNWSDYIGPNVVSGFEKKTGVKVNYDTFDANETLEAKLQAGSSGYDIAVPTLTPFLARDIKAGLYQKIDKSKLKNYDNLDKGLLEIMAKYDPGNEHAIPWVSATDAIGYNAQKVKQILPNAPTDSWALIYNPENASKLKNCGIELLDSPTDVIPVVLNYLGLDPKTEKSEDLKKAQDVLFKIRPYVRKFDSSGYINDLANGDICVAHGWSTDISIAGKRAKEAGKTYDVILSIPKEGTLVYIDSMAVPKGAPNYDLAMQWLDHVMEPEVAADTANTIRGRVGVAAAKPFIEKEVVENPGVYPSAEVQKTFFTIGVASAQFERERTRAWTRIKTGR